MFTKLKQLLKNASIYSTLAAFVIVTAVPAVSAYVYKAKNGNVYDDTDFWSNVTEISSTVSNGYASFSWQHPDTYHEGHAVYVTEGDFVGGLENYQPVFVPKSTNWYTYPKQFNTKTKVSVKVYGYIALESNAKKYIQPGFSSSVWVDPQSMQAFGAPTINYPQNGAVLTNYPRTAFLSWTKVAAAQKYEIDLACDYCNSSSVKWANPTGKIYTSFNNWFTTPALPGDNEYRFKVRGVKANGQVGPWSNYSYFSYKAGNYNPPSYPQSPLNLSITSWSKGMPKLSWSTYTGYNDGYAIMLKEGSWDQAYLASGTPKYYVSKNTTSLQLYGLKENADYSAVVVPYTYSGYNLQILTKAASNRMLFGTGFKSSVEPQPNDPVFNTANFNLTGSNPPAGSVVNYRKDDFSNALNLSFDLPVYNAKNPVVAYVELCKWDLSNCRVVEGVQNVYSKYPNGGKVSVSVSKSNLSYGIEGLGLGGSTSHHLKTRIRVNESANGPINTVYSNNEYGFTFVKEGTGTPTPSPVPTNPPSYDYEGKTGHGFNESSFLGNSMTLNALEQNAKVKLHWSKPSNKYFEGYALYVTEGEFNGGLSNYTPIYLNKNATSYEMPKVFHSNAKVSAYIYPYIELENGAKKFIQPSAQTTLMVHVENVSNGPLGSNVSSALKVDDLIVTTGNKNAYLDWSDLIGLGDRFDKYNIIFKKGYHQNLRGDDVAKSYVSYGSYYHLTGLTAGEWWTFQVVPTQNKDEVGDRSEIVHVLIK